MSRIIKQKKQKQNKEIAVIGEGICEQHYLQSIQHLSKVLIKPKIAKDGIEYLIMEVERCIENGYEEIYCLIDIDTKREGKSKEAYDNFIEKYKRNNVEKKNKLVDITPQVYIIENHPCLEIWFYYYFRYSTSGFDSYEKNNPLKPEFIRVFADYEKKAVFFNNLSRFGGLHQYMIERKKGDFDLALNHSSRSMIHHNQGNGGAYSEMIKLFEIILKDDIKDGLSVFKTKKIETDSK